MADKNLDGNGLSEVWVRAAQLVKKYTGAVDSAKGDLQTQVDTKITGTAISSSSAITTQGEYALDAREKNASVEGTLANQISNLNSNLKKYSIFVLDGDYPIQFKKYGNTVYVYWRQDNIVFPENAQIGTLPSDFIPKATIRYPIIDSNNEVHSSLEISSNGNIYYYKPGESIADNKVRVMNSYNVVIS